MYKMSEVIKVIEDFAPPKIAAAWDNVGLLLGRTERDVAKVLLGLDVTDELVAEAIEGGYQAIITHHPLMRDGLKAINDATPFGRRLLTLAEHKISVYSAHTNLDFCTGGVNDQLFDILELNDRQGLLEDSAGVFAGRAGTMPKPMPLADFAAFVKDKLDLPVGIFYGEPAHEVRKVGMIGGGGANEEAFKAALEIGCDTYVTSDIKYSMSLMAKDMGLKLVDATHYGSEMVFTRSLVKLFAEKLPKLEVHVSKIDGQTIKL